MDFVKLTGAQREFFDENGYLVVPDVLPSEMIDKLTQVSDAKLNRSMQTGLTFKGVLASSKNRIFIPW